MDLAESYRILNLTKDASFEEVKAAYRRLARQFHPDVNAGDRNATERFIQVNQAYKQLTAHMVDSPAGSTGFAAATPANGQTTNQSKSTSGTGKKVTFTVKQPASPQARVQFNPDLSPLERQLKEQSYARLQVLLKTQKLPQAIALVEGLVQRIPNDPEVLQWQAIAYQRWGRHLIQQGQLEKARIYLKKALRADPHNRTLWAEVEKDFH